MGYPFSAGDELLASELNAIVEEDGVDVQIFTGNGTYTKPTGAFWVHVQIWSGGGSGGDDTSSGSSGGGGGAYAEHFFQAGDIGATEAITVGAGGASVSGDVNGNDGGDSSFGSLVTAGGGKKGIRSVTDPDGGDGGRVGNVLVGVFFGLGGEEGVDHGNGLGNGGDGLYSGGGGSSQDDGDNGGDTIYGGGGGGGQGNGNVGGNSVFGGNGGRGFNFGGGTEVAEDGVAPAGGGGAGGATGGSGKGGDGKVIVTTFKSVV